MEKVNRKSSRSFRKSTLDCRDGRAPPGVAGRGEYQHYIAPNIIININIMQRPMSQWSLQCTIISPTECRASIAGLIKLFVLVSENVSARQTQYYKL